MDVKTYRARSLQDALELVRSDLGPEAAVLHTRQLRGGLLRRLVGMREVEVTASANVNVPSRFQEPDGGARDKSPAVSNVPAGSGAASQQPTTAVDLNNPARLPAADAHDYRSQFRDDLKGQLNNLQSLVEDLCRQKQQAQHNELPESLFMLFADLIDAELSEEFARELIDRLRQGSAAGDLEDAVLLRARVARMIEEESTLPVRFGSRRESGGWLPWWDLPGSERPPRSPSWLEIFICANGIGSGSSPWIPIASRQSNSCEPTPILSICPWKSFPRPAKCDRPSIGCQTST